MLPPNGTRISCGLRRREANQSAADEQGGEDHQGETQKQLALEGHEDHAEFRAAVGTAPKALSDARSPGNHATGCREFHHHSMRQTGFEPMTFGSSEGA